MERRHAILPWTAAHAPHWLHRKLEAAFRTGIHAYWLKHPSQAVWRLDWPGKAAVHCRTGTVQRRTRRAAPTLGITRTVIDSATGDLVDIETVERRHAILPWTAAHAPHWLHRKLEAAFRTGIHAYWLKHPSQAVWRLDWPGKAAVLAELERFKGCTRRAAPTLGITVPVTTPAYVDGKYVPYAQRTVLYERPLERRVTLYNDDESEAVERGRLDPHDWQLREWAEAEMTDAVFAIEGGDSSDSMGWLRDGDLDASLAAQLGRDAGQYVAWLGSPPAG